MTADIPVAGGRMILDARLARTPKRSRYAWTVA